MNSREKQIQLYNQKQNNSKANPRVVTPTRKPTRSSVMIEEEALPGIEIAKISYNDLTDKPVIPTALSELDDDSTHRIVTDVEKASWDNKTDNEFAIVMAIVLGP